MALKPLLTQNRVSFALIMKLVCIDLVKGGKIIKGLLLKNPEHTNRNQPSSLCSAKVWCILIEQQSQCAWTKFTSLTELNSSFPTY